MEQKRAKRENGIHVSMEVSWQLPSFTVGERKGGPFTCQFFKTQKYPKF